MNYYILTQGTKSLDYSFMVKNGGIIEPNDKSRDFIRNLFILTEKNGKTISPKDSTTKIIKHKSNFLFEILTKNADRLNRKIPVELLIENYTQDSFTNSDLEKVYILLYNEKIEIEKNNWNSILNQLNIDLKLFQNKKNIKIVVCVSILLITLFITLKFILIWI